jgi:uncharacterized membrane protein
MIDAIPNWLHIVAATAWVGPQIFMFAVIVPALRTVEDLRVRQRIVRVLSTRFSYLAWSAMVVLVLTGICNIFDVRDDYPDVDLTDARFINILTGKLVMVGATIVLTAVHAFVIGPRILDQNDRLIAGDDPPDENDIAFNRRVSIAMSAVNVVLAVAILFMGALLTSREYSLQPR